MCSVQHHISGGSAHYSFSAMHVCTSSTRPVTLREETLRFECLMTLSNFSFVISLTGLPYSLLRKRMFSAGDTKYRVLEPYVTDTPNSVCCRSIPVADILSSEVAKSKQSPSSVHIHYIQKSRKGLWKHGQLTLHHKNHDICSKWSLQIEEFLHHLGTHYITYTDAVYCCL